MVWVHNNARRWNYREKGVKRGRSHLNGTESIIMPRGGIIGRRG